MSVNVGPGVPVADGSETTEQVVRLSRKWEVEASTEECDRHVRMQIGRDLEATIGDPFDSGAVEGMRAAYVELLLDRLGSVPAYQDATDLMERIERLLWQVRS